MQLFKGHIALITGASSGIGKAIAVALSRAGAMVCLVARRVDELQHIAASERALGGELRAYYADLEDAANVKDLIRRINTDFERLDILVHSAAAYSRCKLAVAPTQELERQFRTNVYAPYQLTQGLLPIMPPWQGQIVFINSSAGINAPEFISQYAATKHALKAVADSLRKEVNRDGIRVLSVYLGRTATPLQAAVHAMEERAYCPEKLMQPVDVASVVVNALSLPRTAEVTDITMRSLHGTTA